MKTLPFKRSIPAIAAGVLLLAACGGGGGSSAPADPPIAGTDVPTSATTSSAGAFTFVAGVGASKSESADPIVVGDVTLATSETDEPDPSI